MYAGRTTEADALLVEGFGAVVVDNQQLLQVYIDTKQFDRVIGIWLKRVEGSPDDPQMHIGLATAYFASGDNKNAIAELEKASVLAPTLAPQIRTVINQIKDGTLKP